VNLPIYQVDAFTGDVFGGNPAAVMPLERWLDAGLMQVIAAENNLSETAFFVPAGEGWELRWFTPAVEVDLCGHATLASAHVLFEHLGVTRGELRFQTRSGELRVTRGPGGLTLDFPALPLQPARASAAVSAALGASPEAVQEVSGGNKSLYIYSNAAQVAALAPDFVALRRATPNCVIATAPGEDCDFVSRFFGPQVGIDEDPVTGSAHCALVPYWAQRLDRPVLAARQVSARGGELGCELRGDRVRLTGRAVTFMQGQVFLP